MKSIEERLDNIESNQATLIDRIDALILELRQNEYPKGAVSNSFDDEIEHIAEEVRRETL